MKTSSPDNAKVIHRALETNVMPYMPMIPEVATKQKSKSKVRLLKFALPRLPRRWGHPDSPSKGGE